MQLDVEVGQRRRRASLTEQRRTSEPIEHHTGPTVDLDHRVHGGTRRTCGMDGTGSFVLHGGERFEARREQFHHRLCRPRVDLARDAPTDQLTERGCHATTVRGAARLVTVLGPPRRRKPTGRPAGQQHRPQAGSSISGGGPRTRLPRLSSLDVSCRIETAQPSGTGSRRFHPAPRYSSSRPPGRPRTRNLASGEVTRNAWGFRAEGRRRRPCSGPGVDRPPRPECFLRAR